MTDRPYEFTEDWFETSLPLWDILLENLKPKKVLEVGSFEGRSACFTIEKATQYNPLEMYCVDTWAGGIEHEGLNFEDIERRFSNNIQLAVNGNAHESQVRVMKHPSIHALSHLVSTGHGSTFDLVYIDGSHLACDALADAVLGFELVRPYGVMIFDDYNGGYDYKDPMLPHLGIDSFLNSYQHRWKLFPFMLDETTLYKADTFYQLYLQKIK